MPREAWNALSTKNRALWYWIMKSKVPTSRPGMFTSRLPMTELTMRHLNRSGASPDVPAANLAWHQAAGKYGRIPGIKLADHRGRRGLQCHPWLIRIVCRMFFEYSGPVSRRYGRRPRKRMEKHRVIFERLKSCACEIRFQAIRDVKKYIRWIKYIATFHFRYARNAISLGFRTRFLFVCIVWLVFHSL